MLDHKAVFDAGYCKGEIPAEVLLARRVCRLIPLVAQLLPQPLRHIITEATGINEIFALFGRVKRRASECDHRFHCCLHYRMFTARAASSAIVASEMRDWSIMRTLAQRDKTGTSVGEKAVEVLKARKR